MSWGCCDELCDVAELSENSMIRAEQLGNEGEGGDCTLVEEEDASRQAKTFGTDAHCCVSTAS